MNLAHILKGLESVETLLSGVTLRDQSNCANISMALAVIREIKSEVKFYTNFFDMKD